MDYRKEKDSMGEIEVPEDKYWGAQTQRAKENFHIGSQHIPLELIHAYGVVKKACAITNHALGLLDEDKKELIVKASDLIIAEELDDHFPLVIFQTGSGTQTNMNVNEVIANVAIEMAGGVKGSKDPIHPNDHVNMSQSTNDTFPTSIHISSCLLIKLKLLPALKKIHQGFVEKSREFSDVIKVGRTHLMDATPITVGQEFSGYAAQVEYGMRAVESALKHLEELPIGGTAVGTGINTHPDYASKVVGEIVKITKHSFRSAPNLFEGISSRDAAVGMSGALRQIAVSFTKIANDIRRSGSGPRAGISELILPANEPGSSIMPGKVNPTQCEAMTMVCAEVMGNDHTISISAMQGHYQLNTFMPLIAFKLIESIHLLADVSLNFLEKCLKGIQLNEKRIQENLEANLILATALNRSLGYDKASLIVKKAYSEEKTLREAALELKLLSGEEFDKIVDPKKMIHPNL